MRRFKRIHDDVENVEDYRPGGYHPVHLHDIFNQRYEVIAKLSYGHFSTVWLARLQLHVALKILKADASRDSKELAILLRLSDPSDDEHPGKKHVMTLLDHFDHVAFNGTHLCLVLPVMMSDGEMITMRRKPHQADYVRAISEQILLGLDFLHGLGIIHGDLNPANILFSIAGATTSDDDISLQPPKYSPVTWLEGVEVDNSAPRYLMTSQRFCGTLDDADFSMLVVKIGDMGGATRSDQRD